MGGGTEERLTSPVDDVFRCPACVGELASDGATLSCTSCGREYPIRGGIPRFVPSVAPDVRQVQRVFDFEHRRHDRSLLTQFGPQLVDQFLADCRIRPDFFAGKRALDAGCGSGRWTYALAGLGADVTAIDLTAGGIESAHAALRQHDGARFAQADLFALPFAPESFDFIMSWGVLHHTPDTHLAFSKLIPLVRPGGTLYVMVYEEIPRLMWAGTQALRLALRQFPEESRYSICRRLVIDSRAHPFLTRALGKFLMIAAYDPLTSTVDPETYQFGLFDAYSPRWNHVHSRAEVAGWFRDAGFEHITVVDSPHGAVKVRGVKPAVPSRLRTTHIEHGHAPADATWIHEFTQRRGRPPRVLHFGNIANNGYLNAKIQRREGIEADVVSFDYYHVMGCPEWEDADFDVDVDEFYPDWSKVDLRDWKRPRWFVQGPMSTCIEYLLAWRDGDADRSERLWRKLEQERWLIASRSRRAAAMRRAALGVRAVRHPRRVAGRLKRELSDARHSQAVVSDVSRPTRIARLGTMKAFGLARATREIAGGMHPKRALARHVFPSRLGSALTAADRDDLSPRHRAPAARVDATEPGDAVTERFAELFPSRLDQLRVDDYMPWKELGERWAPVFAEYDVVQAYATYPAIPMFAGVGPFAGYEHGTLRDIPFEPTGVGRITALGYRESPIVFVTNADDLDAAERLGIAEERVVSLPHAVDTKKLFEFAAANPHLLPAPESQVTFFAPARQDWVDGFPSQLKGNDRIVRAVRLLLDRDVHVNVVLVDWGRHVENTKELIADLACESAFTWVGRLRKQELWSRYLGSHAVLDQFVMKAIGGVTFEAMALGCRVITALDARVNARFFGESPPLLAADTPEEIADAMQAVADDPGDEGARGLACLEWMRTYHSSERIVALQADAYRRLIDAQAP